MTPSWFISNFYLKYVFLNNSDNFRDFNSFFGNVRKMSAFNSFKKKEKKFFFCFCRWEVTLIQRTTSILFLFDPKNDKYFISHNKIYFISLWSKERQVFYFSPQYHPWIKQRGHNNPISLLLKTRTGCQALKSNMELSKITSLENWSF